MFQPKPNVPLFEKVFCRIFELEAFVHTTFQHARAFCFASENDDIFNSLSLQSVNDKVESFASFFIRIAKMEFSRYALDATIY